MAKKKNDLDDFDFDDDAMFEAMSFGDDDDGDGISKAAKKHHPIRTMSTSFAGGAAAAMLSTSALKSFTRAALPKGYTSALEAGEDVFGSLSNLYSDAVKELEPAMPVIRKAAGMLHDKAEGILPKSIAESIKRFSEHEEYKGRSQEEEDDAKINDDLAEIFKAQSEETAKNSAKDRAERYMRYSVQDKQTAVSVEILSKIASGTNRLVAYQDKINFKYQQKTLENQYRQTFFLRDILKVQSDQFSLLKEGIEKIVLNTALSDAQKQKSESTLGSKFTSMVSGAASSLTRNMTSKLLEGLTSNIKGAMGSAVEMLTGISEAAEVMDDMGGMHKGGKTGAISEQVGGMFAQFLLPHIALPFQKLFGKSARGMRAGSFLENAFSQTAAKINRWKNSDTTGDGGWLENAIQALKELTPGFEQEKYVGGSMLTTADKAAPFDRLTRRSIVEIIPGFLSRILSETSTIRAGLKFRAPDDSKRVVYNLHKGQFTSFDVALKDTQDSVVSEDSNFRLQQSVNKAVDFVDDGQSTAEYRQKLAQFIALNSSKMTVMDKNFFRDSVGKELFSKPELERTKELFKKKFVNDLGQVNYRNINELEQLYSPIQHDIADPTIQLRHLRNSGGGEFLDRLSYVGREGNTLTINHDEALRLQMTGKGVEAAKKKEYDFVKNLIDIPKSWWAGKADAIAERIYENPVYASWSESAGDFVEFTMVRFWKYASALLNGRSFADIDDEDIDDMFDGFVEGEIDYAVANGGEPHTGPVPLTLAEVDTARAERREERKKKFDTAIDSGKKKAQKVKKTANRVIDHGSKVTDVVRKNAGKATKTITDAVTKTATNVSEGYEKDGLKGAANVARTEVDKLVGAVDKKTKTARTKIVETAQEAKKRLSESSQAVKEAYQKDGLSAALAVSKREGRALVDNGKDLYTKGSKGATLFAKKLAAGEYRDRFSGETLKVWDDIKGDVVDAKGRVVLTARKMRDGIYNEHGELIDSVTLAARDYMEDGKNRFMEERDKIMQTETGKRAAEGMQQGLEVIKGTANRIKGKLDKYAPGITKKLSDFFNPDKSDDVDVDGQRKFGGPVQAGKAYIVGEKQPEIFVPEEDGQIIPDERGVFQHSASLIDQRLSGYTVDDSAVSIVKAFLGEAKRARNPEEARVILDRAYALFDNIQDPKKAEVILDRMIDVERLFMDRGLYKSARELPTFDRSAAIIESPNDKQLDASALMQTQGDARLDHLATLVELNTRHLMLTDGIFHQMQKSMMPTDAEGKPLKKVGRWSGPIDVLRGMGRGTLAGARGFGKYLSTMYGLQMGALTGAVKLGWTVTSGTARGIKNLIFDGPHENASDIYVKGNMQEPVLLRKHMIDGHYLDVKTNKPVKKVDDITGPVKDIRDGNIVLSQEEYDQGITDNIGNRIGTGISKGLRSITSAFASYSGSVFALPFKLARTALNFSSKAVEMINEGQDVYIKGKLNQVALYNKWIKEGRYISARRNRPIKSYRDVDGEIFYYDNETKEKRVVITAEEFADPQFALVDHRGKRLQTLGQKGLGLLGGLTDVATKSAVGLVKGYAKVMGAGLGLARDFVVGTARGIGNFFNPKRRGSRNRIESVDERQYQVLEDILGILMDRLPPPKILREGSWEMQFRKRKEDAEKRQTEKKEKGQKDGGLFGGLKSLFGKGKAGLLGLLGLGGDDEEGDEDGSLLDDGLDAIDTAADLNSLRGDRSDAKTKRARNKEAKRLRKLRRKGLRGRELRRARKGRGKAGLLRRGWNRLRGAKGAAGTATRGGGALRGASRLSGVARGAGVAGAAIGLGLGAKQLYDVRNDRKLTEEQRRDETIVTGNEVVGGAGGAWAGAAAGAALGTAILPVGGTLIGGVVGGGLGYMAGSSVGRKIGEATKDMSGGELAMSLAMPWTIPLSLMKNYVKSKLDLRRDEPFRKYRALQYGIDPTNTEQLSAVMQLEDMLDRAVVFGQNGAQLDGNKMNVEDIFNLFDAGEGGFLKKSWNATKAIGRFAANWLNPVGWAANAMGHGLKAGDNPNLSGPQNAVCAWFNKRFKPIYLSWKTVLHTVTEGKVEKLKDAWDRTDAEQRKRLLKQLQVDSGIYALDTSPFADGKLITSEKAIKAAAEAAMAEVDKKPGSSNKAGWRGTLLGSMVAGMARKTQLAAGSLAEKLENIDKAMPTWMKFTPVGAVVKVASKIGSWALRVLESGAEKIAGKVAPPAKGMKPGEQVTAMMAARYKAYGLKDMHPERVNTLYIMERTLVEETRVSGKSESSIDKNGKEAYSQFASLFGLQLEDSAARDIWIDWFKSRFMPVFLTYVAGVRQVVPSGDIWAAEKSMTPVQRIVLCKALITAKRTVKLVFKAGIWTYLTSPWDGKDTLNGDPKSVMENVYAIQKEVDGKTLPQQTAESPKNDADGKSTTPSPVPPPKPPAKSQDPIANPGSAGSANDQVGGGDDDAYARMQQQDSAYWDSKGVDSSQIKMENGRLPPYKPVKMSGSAKQNEKILLQTATAAGITDKNELISLMSQTASESGHFSQTKENIKWSPTTMARLWPNRFPSMETAKAIHSQGPEAVAEKVYGGRMGNDQPGDGAKYIGRGFIQLTGKDNYEALQKRTGLNVVQDPDIIARDPKAASQSAVDFWLNRGPGLRAAAQRGDVEKTTKLVNGGYNGLSERKSLFAQYASRIDELLETSKSTGGETSSQETSSDQTTSSESIANNTSSSPKSQGKVPTSEPAKPVSSPAKSDTSSPGFFSRASTWVGDRVSQTVAGAKQLASDVSAIPKAVYTTAKNVGTAVGAWVGKSAQSTGNAGMYAVNAVADTVSGAIKAIGNSLMSKVASYARDNAEPRSVGRCARYVANALVKAGFKFVRQGSAWMYWKNGILEQMGFKPMPQGTKPQIGDIMVFDRSPAHKHGHIQIFDGSNWVSDFVQRSWTPYKNPPPCCLFRHSGSSTAAAEPTGAAQSTGASTGSPSTTDNPSASSTGNATETSNAAVNTANSSTLGGPVDIANPGGIAQAAPIDLDQTLSDSSGRDAVVRNAQQQANYQQSMDQRRDQLAGDDIRKFLSDQRDIQQRQLDTQIEMSGKLSEQIEKLTQIADAVSNIKAPAAPNESVKTEEKDMRGPKRSKPPFESRPARSPLNVVRSVIRHA